jgi:hypothetical protein
MDREFRKLVARVEKERHGTWVVSSILLVLFVMVAMEAARLSLIYVPKLIHASSATEVAPEFSTTTIITDVFLVAGPVILFTICIFVIFFLMIGLVSRNHYKLVLRMAKEFAGEKGAGDGKENRADGVQGSLLDDSLT